MQLLLQNIPRDSDGSQTPHITYLRKDLHLASSQHDAFGANTY